MIRYDTTHWPSSARCGNIIYSGYDLEPSSPSDPYVYGTAGSNGRFLDYRINIDKKCTCSIKYGPAGTGPIINWYVALCAADKWPSNWNDGDNSVDNWIKTNNNYCPRGWGRLYYRYPRPYSVLNGQRYYEDAQSEPVYGYVTRYRTEYYTYIAGRVSKA